MNRCLSLKLLILFISASAIHDSSAGTTNIYVEDWGTYNGGASLAVSGDLGSVGWTGVAVSQTAGPYLGIYQAEGPTDVGSGAALPVNTAYFTDLLPNQTTPGMFYTTDAAGAGSGGDSSFTDIDPTQYTNLTLSAEVREQTAGMTSTNYFAVQVGGSWYVATGNPLPVYTGAYPDFTNATMLYTNLASVWNNLTIGDTGVTIGSVAGANLSGPITGVGIVELPTTDGFNYSQLAISASTTSGGSPGPNTNFLAGADFSDLAYFQSLGVTYKEGGQVQDGIQILKNLGINCVRLRLWTSSQSQALSNPYNYINNTTYTVPLAVRVKNAGLLFLLDFHYSDTWADPGHQAIPSAWTNGLTFTGLVQLMRTYNSNTIATFAAAGAMPDYVQIGNEITDGMLWPYGAVSNSYNTAWSQLGQLMKAAVLGIQDATGALGVNMPKIIVHIDQGGNWANTEWFFDNLDYQGVPFDIIGESYYPFFQGSPSSLSNCLNNAAIRYGKPIIVAEDAFPWTNSCPSSWLSKLYGYPPTETGQVSFIATVAQIVEGVPNQLGAGLFYWGAEYQAVNGVNEAGYNTSSFFDNGGNVLPVAGAVAGIAAPLVITTSLVGSNVQLQWPFSGAASELMTSAGLPPLAAWSLVTNPIQITGSVFTVTLPATNNAGFYLLQSN
ncbi:MAG: glycosyl hydrolase 53 family protein [Verrucomicrobiota bacterium]|jgi:arabinogalactan endo-1,4-beta-galactosidase